MLLGLGHIGEEGRQIRGLANHIRKSLLAVGRRPAQLYVQLSAVEPEETCCDFIPIIVVKFCELSLLHSGLGVAVEVPPV
jgi:hypothetical protein